MSEDESAKIFLDIVSRMPRTMTCCKCGHVQNNSPASEFDSNAGYEIITDPKTGHRRQGGYICGNCMTGGNSK